jgi:hypothetical protein
LSRVTSFTLTIKKSTLTKPTTCFITSGQVSQCRRKRGMEEKPLIIKFDEDDVIVPSAVMR